MVHFSSNFGGNFDSGYDEAKKIAQEGKENKIEKILEIVKKLETQLNRQQEQFNKLISLISKMYEDGEINKDTLNKLDEFLKPYIDNPYQDGKY